MGQDQILTKQWRWIPAAERVEAILSSWEGTRYMALKCVKGVVVDCIRYVCGAGDELYGYSRGPMISLPADQSMHDREGSVRAMRAICERYAPLDDVTDDGCIEPGDILVTGPVGGGPGHAMIVGGKRNHVWECLQGIGVRQSGLPAFGKHMQLFRIYRVQDKHLWMPN